MAKRSQRQEIERGSLDGLWRLVDGIETDVDDATTDHVFQSRPTSFARKTAIWPRVTGSFGQKFPPPHPAVTPAAASAST